MKHATPDWKKTQSTPRTTASIRDVVSELKLILADCRRQLANPELSTDAAERLNSASRKIEAAIALLTGSGAPAFSQTGTDVENPSRELPQCSVEGCPNAAGAVMDGALLCGLHASQALLHRRAPRN